MATRGNGSRSGDRPPHVVDKVTQRKLTGAMVWLNVCVVVILCLVLTVGSLYMDLKTAEGANKVMNKKISSLKHQYEIYCRKEN